MTERQSEYKIDYTVKALAKKAGVSGRYIRKLIGEEKLEAVKRDGEGIWIIPHTEAQNWLKNRQAKIERLKNKTR